MTVKYIDDRYAGGPSVCVRAFFQGTQSAEICDKEIRKAGELWKVGALSAKSGSFEQAAKGPDTPMPATTTTAPAKKPPQTLPPVAGNKPPAGKPPVANTKPPAKPPGGSGAGVFNP
jgi:hypothetical protein